MTGLVKTSPPGPWTAQGPFKKERTLTHTRVLHVIEGIFPFQTFSVPDTLCEGQGFGFDKITWITRTSLS